MRRSRQPSHKSAYKKINLDLAFKDAISFFGVWIVLEIFSFAVLPGFKLIPSALPEDEQLNWFYLSLPLGLAGIVLTGLSSELIRYCQENVYGFNQKLLVWLGQALGWLGLAGVGFPLSIVGLELWLALTSGKPIP